MNHSNVIVSLTGSFISILIAASCTTSSDSTLPTTLPETIVTSAAPSTTGQQEAHIPETTTPLVSVIQSPDTTVTPLPTTTTTTTTTLPSPLLDNIAVLTSAGLSCSLRADSSVYCWGGDPLDEEGNRVRFDTDIPSKLESISDAVAIEVIPIQRCVLQAEWIVSCGERNENGGFGVRTDIDFFRPNKDFNITDVIDISNGYDHGCAVHVSGTVSCWGSNELGQLGNAGNSDSEVPARVVDIVDALEVSVGEDHSCALHSDGSVSCWGSNEFGQLGDGTTEDSATPIRVTGISDAVSVAVDEDYSCIIHANGGVSCWGSNQFGTLGYGEELDYYDYSVEPVRVPNVESVVELSTDRHYICAILTDNTAMCWGYDKYGIFTKGYGNEIYITLPTVLSPSYVTAMKPITAMSAGRGYICVIHTDTTVFCWGYDPLYSVLGNPEQARSGKIGRAYVDPDRNLAYIIAPYN